MLTPSLLLLVTPLHHIITSSTAGRSTAIISSNSAHTIQVLWHK
jgi:hypothetical protein